MEETQQAADLHPHAHHAIQITFRLAGSFEIGVGNETLSAPVVAIGSDVLHSFRAKGAVAFLFVAPESQVGRALMTDLFSQQSCAIVTGGPLTATLNDLADCFRRSGTEREFRLVGRKAIDQLPLGGVELLPDPRVLGMIDYARQNLEDSVALPAAADSVNLSHSRARHLFVAHTQLPFKTYVLWLRLQRAVEHYAAGGSLTEAAHLAGFADSAHLSRTFKRTFGLPAAALRLYRD